MYISSSLLVVTNRTKIIVFYSPVKRKSSPTTNLKACQHKCCYMKFESRLQVAGRSTTIFIDLYHQLVRHTSVAIFKQPDFLNQ